MTQAEFGERVGRYLGRAWSRQTVSAAEKGGRAFTALELMVISIVLGIPVNVLFLPHPAASEIDLETPGGVPLPMELVISHAVAEPQEREEIVRKYTETHEQLVQMKRELDEAQRFIASMKNSPLSDELIDDLTEQVALRIRRQLGREGGGSAASGNEGPDEES